MATRESLPVVAPANGVPGPPQGQWTYTEYAAIPEDGQRYEVVRGILYMAPSPGWEHQEIVLEIASYLRSFVKEAGLGKVGVAPLDVELGLGTIVQPDVFVVLNRHLDSITPSRVIGAPDLVVEVSSPSTARHDLHEKLEAYAAAGVPEYWVVNPDARMLEVLALEQGNYRSLGLFSGSSLISSRILPGLAVTVGVFFT